MNQTINDESGPDLASDLSNLPPPRRVRRPMAPSTTPTPQASRKDITSEKPQDNGFPGSGVTTDLTTFELLDVAAQLIQSDSPPMMLWGLTGVGKSQLVRQVIHKVSDRTRSWKSGADVPERGGLEVINDWGLLDMRVSLLEPTDLMGLPNLDGEIVRWVVPSELPAIGQESRFPTRGILFLDELNHAQPAMQNACFSLVLDRRCGPHLLLPGWRIIAASNCNQENANSFPMSAPLRNRFAHFHIRCSLDAFKRWAFQNEVDSRVIAFLNWNPAELHNATDNPEESFPTPRSWANVSRLLKVFGPSQLGPAITACVGPGSATIFMAFLRLNACSDLMVDVPQVLRGKARPPKFNMERPDLAWAFAGRVTASVQETRALLSSAIGFYCSPTWKETLEIGRTGLADLKYLVSEAEFNRALSTHLEACEKYYGGLL